MGHTLFPLQPFVLIPQSLGLSLHIAQVRRQFLQQIQQPPNQPAGVFVLDLAQIEVLYHRAVSLPVDFHFGKQMFLKGQDEYIIAGDEVVLLKTHLKTQAQAHVVLFSTDLELAYAKIIQFYRLRFQIEFNFRDCKQHWGLEDFMNVKETAVTNAANLAFLMVNFSYALLQPFRQTCPDFSVLDLKSHFRRCRYAAETIKMLAQKPDAILLADIFQQIARLGAIHPAFQPSAVP